MPRFRNGEKVVKAYKFSDSDYCMYGGDEYALPLGSVGKIDYYDSGDPFVKFENGQFWHLHESELDFYSIWIATGDLTKDEEKYLKGFDILCEYMDCIPDEDKEKVDKKLTEIGL